MNDSRIDALCKKYGVQDVDFKKSLINIANLKKVEVFTREKIHYYQYEKNELVYKIPVCKKYILALVEYFKKVEDLTQEHELIYSADSFGMYKSLEIKNLQSGQKFSINTVID